MFCCKLILLNSFRCLLDKTAYQIKNQLFVMALLYTFFVPFFQYKFPLQVDFSFTCFMNDVFPYLAREPNRSQCAVVYFVGVVWMGKQ